MAHNENRPAVGYVRVEERDDTLVARLRLAIGDYCKREGLQLSTVFCDRGYDGRELARPGISAVIEKLKDTTGLTVLVPDLDHLSPFSSIRGALEQVVQRHDGFLLVVDEPASETALHAMQHAKARTWQDCAKAIDPSLPEVQPKLSE